MQKKTSEKKTIRDVHATAPFSDPFMEHRKGERRKCECRGYTYISMVGWMCRREQARRGKDKI